MNRPDHRRVQLEHEYSTALRDCVSGAGEVALSHAYELGRMAAGTGIGVVELAEIHDHAMREVLGEQAPPAAADQFFAEALSPFEMTHRGFREANARLEAANRELEAEEHLARPGDDREVVSRALDVRDAEGHDVLAVEIGRAHV